MVSGLDGEYKKVLNHKQMSESTKQFYKCDVRIKAIPEEMEKFSAYSDFPNRSEVLENTKRQKLCH